ncbi:MAG: ribosome silencing factor [Candidatus Rifleibacteriota bacterium]
MAAKKKIPELMKIIVDSLREKKIENLRVLDVTKLVSYTDYLVIGTGNNGPHIQALADAAAGLIKVPNQPGVRMEKDAVSSWVLIDADDFIVHLFQPEARKFYKLEQLWEDAADVEV